MKHDEGTLQTIRRSFPVQLLVDIAELCRQRYNGRLVLDFHDGKVCSSEMRTRQHYGRKRA